MYKSYYWCAYFLARLFQQLFKILVNPGGCQHCGALIKAMLSNFALSKSFTTVVTGSFLLPITACSCRLHKWKAYLCLFLGIKRGRNGEMGRRTGRYWMTNGTASYTTSCLLNSDMIFFISLHIFFVQQNCFQYSNTTRTWELLTEVKAVWIF